MRKKLGIRTYLIISHSLLLIISLGAIGFIWSLSEYRVVTEQIESLMRDRVSLLSRIISHEIEEHDQIKLDRSEYVELNLKENVVAVYIDNSGTLVELVPGTVSPYQLNMFLELGRDDTVDTASYTALIRSEPETNSVYAAAPVFDANNQIIGKVCLLMPLGDLESYILRLRWMLIGGILVVALLGVGVSTLLANSFSHQFSRAQGLAATISSGDYDLRIPEKGPTELHDLSHYLNQMAEELQEQLMTRQRLLSNVTHELAHPLAGLKLGVESLRKGAIQDVDLADDLLVSMEQSITRLESLIDDITLAAYPKTRPIGLDCTALAVEPFLKGIATRFRPLAGSRGLKLEVQVEAGLPSVFADEKRLNQILVNLIDNAIKFTPRGKIIRLTGALADQSNICLSVHDGGPGITPQEAGYIFQPFYQGETGRRIKQGMGLGLSIAHQLAQAHNGSLKLMNHPEGGLIAILTLPRADI
jgi:signal transduction histidine kinase